MQREFWRLVLSGCTIGEAAQRVGFEKTAGQRWFLKAGGMSPLSLEEPPEKTRALNIRDREKILQGVTAELSIRAIAHSIGRSPSTVLRELRSNMPRQQYRTRRKLGGVHPGGRRVNPWSYSPHLAQQRADARLARPKVAKLVGNERLRKEVEDRLGEEHSPEQISNRLREDFPDDPEMWVSHETIYQSLYVQSRGALRRDLTARLRTGRAVRRPQRRSDRRRARVLGMVNISERPPEVEDRAVAGHWEGDLIIGKDSRSAIGTLVERTSRFVMLLHLPHDHGADAVQEAMVAAMSQLPQTLKKTLTWDQGIEMANHVQIAAATDLDIFFCDPHSPWQRGSNENTNGLLRQYFPKSSDLSGYAPDYLDHVARKLNNRPRKTLDWKTPAEVLDKLLSEPLKPPGVALTG
ncbi:MAG: IS30 family transposase [Nocardioides sp.]